MTLEQQVCSLELAKRLKELGVKQESHFVWHREGSLASVELNDEKNYPLGVERCAAFTVAELGGMLPAEINIPFKNGKPRAVNNSLKAYFGVGRSEVHLYYAKPAGTNEYVHMKGASEADARAMMLIYLLENKLITL